MWAILPQASSGFESGRCESARLAVVPTTSLPCATHRLIAAHRSSTPDSAWQTALFLCLSVAIDYR
eukprot:2554327-Rhodomonas_salina.1